MRTTIEKLWNEHFFEECSVIETEEERMLIRKADGLHKKINEMLTKEQREDVEQYIGLLYEMQSNHTKKSFFKGCKFAMSFIFELDIWCRK